MQHYQEHVCHPEYYGSVKFDYTLNSVLTLHPPLPDHHGDMMGSLISPICSRWRERSREWHGSSPRAPRTEMNPADVTHLATYS